jgi:hypothetical protein
MTFLNSLISIRSPARWREYMMTAVADRLRPWARVGEEMVTLRTFSRSRRSTSLR